MWQVGKSQQLIAADCFNVKEMMPPNGTKKWASGLDEKQDFRITDLRLETAVFDTLQQQLTRTKPDHAGLLARSGPYYAKPRDPNSTVGDTCFGGPYCAMWFHFSASDPRALRLLAEGINARKSNKWWLETGLAIVSTQLHDLL